MGCSASHAERSDSAKYPVPSTNKSPGKEVSTNTNMSRRYDKAAATGQEILIGGNKDNWPVFDPPLVDELSGTGSFVMDFVNSAGSRWARGEAIEPSELGPLPHPGAHPNGRPARECPLRLFDLATKRVVYGADVAPVNWAVVSHVWGPTRNVIGSKYGVPWSIPIRSTKKLESIFEAARVNMGERYIWIDVLCFDQRRKDPDEILNMGSIFQRATGCMVWLDDPDNVDQGMWHEALTAIESVNKLFSMDRYAIPTTSVKDFVQGQNLVSLSMNSQEIAEWISRVLQIETAPWFKRVWTLQEAVIPDYLLLVTPERYRINGAQLFQLIGVCEMMCKTLRGVDDGTALRVNQLLQKSEIFKTLKLRQLYRARQIGYWHLQQAVRTRECTIPQDKIFGLYGLVHPDNPPAVDYNANIAAISRNLYRRYINSQAFETLMFLGDPSRLTYPDPESSQGFCTSLDTREWNESHLLAWSGDDTVKLTGTGLERIDNLHCIVGFGAMADWQDNWGFPHLLDLSVSETIDIARAFNLSPVLMKSALICPASFTAMTGFQGLSEEKLDALGLGQEFKDLYKAALPQAIMTWNKIFYFGQGAVNQTMAICVVWTKANKPLLAILNFPASKTSTFWLVTPSSYVSSEGEGCLICEEEIGTGAPRTMRKIGVAIGPGIKASNLDNLTLVGAATTIPRQGTSAPSPNQSSEGTLREHVWASIVAQHNENAPGPSRSSASSVPAQQTGNSFQSTQGTRHLPSPSNFYPASNMSELGAVDRLPELGDSSQSTQNATDLPNSQNPNRASQYTDNISELSGSSRRPELRGNHPQGLPELRGDHSKGLPELDGSS